MFDLLPAGTLDGGRVVKALIMKHGGVVEAELWHHRISAGIALLVCMLGVYHVYIWGGNLTLLLTVGWLLLGAKQAVL